MKTFFCLMFAFMFSQTALADSCKENLKNLACVTEGLFQFQIGLSQLENTRRGQNQKCSKNKAYTDRLLDAYDRLPSDTKLGFCELKKIFIVPGDIDFGGSVVFHYDLEHPIQDSETSGLYASDGVILYISEKHRFINTETIEEIENRQWQRFLGHNVAQNGISYELPRLKILDPHLASESSLLLTLVHEMGHVFDFYNFNIATFTRYGFFDVSEANYHLNLDPFTSFSWTSDNNPNEHGRYFLKPSIDPVFFDLNKNANLRVKALMESSLMTRYATSNPAEDIAETYATTVLGLARAYVDSQNRVISDDNTRTHENIEKKKQFILDYVSSNNFKRNLSTISLSKRMTYGNPIQSQICKHPY